VADKINTRLEKVIYSNQRAKMKIICYGTNRYGRIIEDVITSFSNILLDVIVCSPIVEIFGDNIDKSKMLDNINYILKAKNINKWLSEIPPTIRASLVYNEENEPIWCAMQSYYIFRNKLLMFRGEAYAPAIVSDVSNRPLLQDMTRYFNMEFDRLKNESDNADKPSLEKYFENVIN
jgi:hypothetical protein